jgi:hypothetical protein
LLVVVPAVALFALTLVAALRLKIPATTPAGRRP